MAFHALSDFVGGLWRNNKDYRLDEEIQVQEFESQEQWKRDFEEGNDGIIGKIRDGIRKAKIQGIVPGGINIHVRNVQYLSPPLQNEISTIPNLLLHHFNMYRRVKDTFAQDHSNQKQILSDINFDIKEGTMTLVIGSPGSGKVKFL